MEQKTTTIIPEKQQFEVPQDNYVQINRFTLTEDNPEFNGLRIVVFADVKSQTKDNRELVTRTAISSFIVGKDFEQSAEIVFSPYENVVISATGPSLSIQVLYNEFKC